MVFHHLAPSSSQSDLLPECLGRYDKGPDGVADWQQEGAGHTKGKDLLCAGSALCPPRVRFMSTSTVHLRSKILRRIRSGLCKNHLCLSERIFTYEIYMYLHVFQLLAALLALTPIQKHPCIAMDILIHLFGCIQLYDSTRI